MKEDGIDIIEYPRDPEGLEAAYAKNVDFYGNGRRGLFKAVTPSLIDFLEKNTSVFNKIDRTGVINYAVPTRWCDIGIGGGFAMEAIIEEAYKRDYVVEPSGIDVAPSAIAACKEKWTGFDFRAQNVAEPWPDDMPWRNADVVSFLEVLYMFRDSKGNLVANQVFDRVYAELRPGTVIAISDNNIRHHRRVYPMSIPDCAFLGKWTDRTMPVVEHRFTKYAIYRKMA